jgi:hypothetical protein
MAYINGNKPIVTDGLVYALDFGNTKSYTSGSNRARSLVFDTATTIVTGSAGIPILTAQGLDFTSNQWIQRSASLSALDPNGTFTICAVVKANTAGTLFTQNSAVGNLSGRFQSTSSLSTGFTLSSGDFSRIYTGNFTGSQHVTYRYNSGSFDTFINGIPVTASQANTALTGSSLTSTLFINSGSLPFSGSLSSFYVYNRALTADEVYQNFEIASTRYGLPYRPKPYTIDENLYQFLQTTGITDTVTTNALSTFISGLKSNGLWNKMVAIYPFVSNTTSSLTTNLKEPGIYRLALTGSYSASALGLTPSSSTAFIDTIPSNTAYSLVNSQSAHLTVLSYDLPTGTGFLAGNSLPAVGGDLIVQSGSRMLHVFRTTGTSSFTIANPAISNVEVLVVGGGGGGGEGNGGGGGAGGLVYSSSFSITPGSPLQVIVGNGGLSSNGGNSVFGTITALGGGKGGNYRAGAASSGSNGGSGGGAGNNFDDTFTPGGTGSAGQGNNGGASSGSLGHKPAGGGGGAGSPGISGYVLPNDNIAANGGSGSYFAQFATVGGSPAGWFAGGGGGGIYADGGNSGRGRGGIGGGGNGDNQGYGVVASNGVANTGGGGGGSVIWRPTLYSGGSGIVIVSYDFPSTSTALTGSGTGLYLTEASITASVNSQFTSGITGSGNIGLLTVTRTQPAAFSIHKNNISQSVASASLGALSTDIFFNTANLAGSSSLPLQAGISFASIGSGLTTSEVATYHNLISQLQSNLKRQNTLLDNFSGAAAAYSLRRIGPSSYFGPAIRVRRDSDNTLRDIGFTSDGQLDTVGLLDFVGVTGSGFVNTWYNSNANGSLSTQSTTGSQASVVTSGSILRISGSSGLLTFDGSSDFYTIPTDVSFGSTITMLFWIYGNYAGYYPSVFERSTLVGASLNTPIANNGWVQVGYMWDGTTNYFIINGIKYAANAGGRFPYDYPNDRPLFWQGRDGFFATNSGPNLSFHLQTAVGANTGFNWSNFNTWPYKTLGVSATAGNPRFYSGSIANTIFYNRALTDSELLANYSQLTSTTSDPDYSAFITATGITQPTQSAALETLVSDLKSYGLWNKMKAIYPMITDKNNRFAYSEEFDNGQWNKSGSIVTPNASPSPLGTVTGELVAEDTSTGDHYIYQTIADGLVTGSEYVASIYGRFLNRPWIAIETNVGARAWFNIQTGITGSLTGSRSTITNIGSGWYRCALYFTSSVASGPQNIQYHLADANNNLTYTGISGTGSYMWGAQFENGNVLGPYRATTTSGFTTGSMLDQMKFNLKNTGSFSGSYFGGWNPGYGGNRPNGTTGYMDTNFAPASNLTLSSAHNSVYLRTNLPISPQVAFGVEQLANQRMVLYPYGFNIGWISDLYDNSTSRISSSSGTSTGFVLGSRASASSHKLFRNSVQLASSTSATTGTLPTLNYYIGGVNLNGSPSFYSTNQIAFYSLGDGLTDYEAKALYWIVQKYQTTLGRQVY